MKFAAEKSFNTRPLLTSVLVIRTAVVGMLRCPAFLDSINYRHKPRRRAMTTFNYTPQEFDIYIGNDVDQKGWQERWEETVFFTKE